MKYKVIVYTRESRYMPLSVDVLDVITHDVSYGEQTKRFHVCAHEMIRIIRSHCEYDEKVMSIRREPGYLEIATYSEFEDEIVYTLNSINTVSIQ